MTTFNLSEVLRSIEAETDEELRPWWFGGIQIAKLDENGNVKFAPKHVYVLPSNDSQDHFSPECACKPTREFVGQGFRLLITHNAFDGRG